MEVIFEIIAQVVVWLFQLFGELVLQALGELIAELIGRSVIEPFRRSKPIRPGFAVVGYAVFGALIGAVSLWLIPALFISEPSLRIVNLLLTPIVAGLMMTRLGAWRKKNEQATTRLNTFAYGFIFA